MGNPYRIETSCHYASMRQIHAAIEHWQRGDFECAMTLAGAAEGMLPDIDERHFRKLQNSTRINEISNWLMHAESGEGMKGDHIDTVVIGELDTVIAIHRAILKFETVFWQDKTPQMRSFRNCARTQALVRSNRRETELHERTGPEIARCQ
jgi:hypothetical protein